MDKGKTLAKSSDRYGAPKLSIVEELDEPVFSDVSIKMCHLRTHYFSP